MSLGCCVIHSKLPLSQNYPLAVQIMWFFTPDSFSLGMFESAALEETKHKIPLFHGSSSRIPSVHHEKVYEERTIYVTLKRNTIKLWWGHMFVTTLKFGLLGWFFKCLLALLPPEVVFTFLGLFPSVLHFPPHPLSHLKAFPNGHSAFIQKSGIISFLYTTSFFCFFWSKGWL